ALAQPQHGSGPAGIEMASDLGQHRPEAGHRGSQQEQAAVAGRQRGIEVGADRQPVREADAGQVSGILAPSPHDLRLRRIPGPEVDRMAPRRVARDGRAPRARPEYRDFHRPQTSSTRTKPVAPWWRTSTQPFAGSVSRSSRTPRATRNRTAAPSSGPARTVAVVAASTCCASPSSLERIQFTEPSMSRTLVEGGRVERTSSGVDSVTMNRLFALSEGAS